jgi:hypothetical protein
MNKKISSSVNGQYKLSRKRELANFWISMVAERQMINKINRFNEKNWFTPQTPSTILKFIVT